MARALQHLALIAFLALLLGGAPLTQTALARVAGPAPGSTAQLATAVESPDEPVIPTADQVAVAPTDAAAATAVPTGVAADQPAADQPDEPTFIALAGGTTVTPARVYSPTLQRSTLYDVILPPGYQASVQRYPVLYMLHGVAGGATEWVGLGLHQAADALWASGEVPPFIIVLPDTGASYYLNHADGGPRWDDFIARELVTEVDATYRTILDPSARAVGGLSMGGDGALRLALRHPDVFGVVGGHSPTTRLSYDQLPGTIFGDVDYWHQNSAIWLIQNTDAAAGLKIWIDDGTGDVWLPSAEALHQALLDKGVDHHYVELEGGHEAEYWEAYAGDYLRFYGSALAHAGLAGGSPAADGAAQ